MNDRITRKGDVLDRIAKFERQAVTVVVKQVNDAIAAATTLPIVLDMTTLTPVVYSCLVKHLNEAGWRVNIGQTINSIASIE